MSKYNDLVKKLKEIFQIDKPELDFGIYRILNAKADEINNYLENTLMKKISDALASAGNANKEELERQLAEAIKNAEGAGFNPDDSPKVKDLRVQIAASSQGANEHENAVFTHLLTFFSRYYDSGDFVSKRRYKGDTYAIPYAGEEVMLHWANKDQYYIKSGENFSNYSFKLEDGRKVTFKLLAADTAKDNRKDNDADRRFVLVEEHTRIKYDDDGLDYEEEVLPVVVDSSGDKDELIIQFEYKAVKKGTKQEALVSQALDAILSNNNIQSDWVDVTKREPTEKNPNRTLLEKHLTTYTQRNTADYFIHKDLGGFLSNELDFYIKNEVMNLDNVQNAEVFSDIEKQLRMIQCLRSIATDIVRFLAQLENFQKKLWTKKKFVVESNYCINLQFIDDSFYEALLSKEQIEEWASLGFIENTNIDANFLKQNKQLIIDTKNYSSEIKERILSQISLPQNRQIPLCIKSDNYQGLRLAQNCFNETVGQVYIDPPYNTGSDGFIYKDSFKSSSWCSFMYDRLMQSKLLLEEKGAIFVSINESERHNLEGILNLAFGNKNRIEEIIWARDTVSNNATAYSTNHEYIEVFAKNKNEILRDKSKFRVQREGYKEVTNLLDELNKAFPEIEAIELAIKNLYSAHRNEHIEEAVAQGLSKEEAQKTDPWKGLYPYKFVEYRDALGKFIDQKNAKERNAKIWLFREVEPSMPAGKQADTTKDPDSENYRFYSVENPLTGETGVAPRAGWAFPRYPIGKRPSFEMHMKNSRIKFKGEGKIPQIKYFLHQVESVISTSVIRQYADGEPKLEAMFGQKGLIDNPKPPALIAKILDQIADDESVILDFFGGSGTTAAATIDFNYERNKDISYFLIEQGSYFDNVLIPRIKKSYLSGSWKNGKALELRKTNKKVVFKYLNLESYEDTLNNLELRKPQTTGDLFDSIPEQAKSDYLLNYMLETESKGSLLSTDDFKKPFDYKMKIAVDSAGAFEERNIDLVETFNYLIGLHLKTVESNIERGYVRVEGDLPSGEKALVLWRDCEKIGYDDFTKFANRFDLFAKEKTFDVIYVNGDHNLPTAFTSDEGEVTRTLKLRQIEPEFLELMFAPDELA
ncbi:DNA methyltransferase [Thalassotalea aquiviva]|uniref:DNA methyltransferase n=1 Tax=Thalassotalea aquiviva TaxID=3242415 RepID=UPI00352A7E72